MLDPCDRPASPRQPSASRLAASPRLTEVVPHDRPCRLRGIFGLCWRRWAGSMLPWWPTRFISRLGRWPARSGRGLRLCLSPAVSVLIVAKNEAHNLAGCLASVSWADERVVVVDSASARRYSGYCDGEADIALVRILTTSPINGTPHWRWRRVLGAVD